jgi:hypothetical protein
MKKKVKIAQEKLAQLLQSIVLNCTEPPSFTPSRHYEQFFYYHPKYQQATERQPDTAVASPKIDLEAILPRTPTIAIATPRTPVFLVSEEIEQTPKL